MHTIHTNITENFIVHQPNRETVTRRLDLKETSVLRYDTFTGGELHLIFPQITVPLSSGSDSQEM